MDEIVYKKCETVICKKCKSNICIECGDIICKKCGRIIPDPECKDWCGHCGYPIGFEVGK